MTYMLLLNCALKLVEEIILYYDARSKKHQTNRSASHRISFACSLLIYGVPDIKIYHEITSFNLNFKFHFTLCFIHIYLTRFSLKMIHNKSKHVGDIRFQK